MNRVPRLLQVIQLHQRSFWRSPESAFFSFAMPLAVLLTYGVTVSNNPLPGRPDVKVLTFFVPGILAFAIVVVAYGNLASTIAAQRADGVLKRLRSTPMQPSLYILGELLSVLAITLLISIATMALGAAVFDARPRVPGVPQLAVILPLGIACFSALGLAISTKIPTADSAAPITNGTYLPLAMVSGMFSPTLHLPRLVGTIVSLFPFKALTDGLRHAYDPASHGLQLGTVMVLSTWTVVGVVLAKRFFRWEP